MHVTMNETKFQQKCHNANYIPGTLLGTEGCSFERRIPSTEIPDRNVTEAFVSTWTKFSVLLIGVFPPLKVVERNVMRALFCWDQSLCAPNSGIACVAVSQSKGFTGPLVLYIIWYWTDNAVTWRRRTSGTPSIMLRQICSLQHKL